MNVLPNCCCHRAIERKIYVVFFDQKLTMNGKENLHAVNMDKGRREQLQIYAHKITVFIYIYSIGNFDFEYMPVGAEQDFLG